MIFSFEESKTVSKTNFLNIFFNTIYRIRFQLKSFNFYKLKIFFKKLLTKVILFKKKDANLIIEPAFDLNYFDYKISETFFKDFGLKKIIFKDNLSEDFQLKYKKKSYLQIIENYLKKNIQFDRGLIKRKTEEIQKFILDNNIKKVFWGISPNPLLANILGNIKRKILRFLEPNTVENILPNKTIFTIRIVIIIFVIIF